MESVSLKTHDTKHCEQKMREFFNKNKINSEHLRKYFQDSFSRQFFNIYLSKTWENFSHKFISHELIAVSWCLKTIQF